ncbi:hypothetical protein CYMTET_54722 [Cymbomonas tetramitiformis]|uniref:Uncharacterized protein n=1 Tax=Cymbomonas tetramitiformis TaxID=36881 RepID=A0AAE0BFJ4_9CHLO|nr:hypothetical protein CYMTET_54722 [Cymbomonas tetramitiformis]
MSQARQSGLAAALRAARSGNTPSTPTPSSHGTASRTTTPLARKVEGREEEYAEHLAYASNYSADLLRFLRASGFKDTVGYTFDNADADADFNILLYGLRHVLVFPINYKELAVIRALGDKHMKINTYPDSKRMQDLWHVLADSAKASPHTAPLYLVVLRELRAGAAFSFASLCLRIRTAWRDEAKHAVLSDRPPPPRGGAALAWGGGYTLTLGRSTLPPAFAPLASPAPLCP